MAEIDIERFRAGDCEKYRADGDERDFRLPDEIGGRIIWIDREDDGRVVGNVEQARNAERQEPDGSDRTEDDRHPAGAEALHCKQRGKDHQRDRNDIRFERRRDHLQSFDRRQHRDRRRDDRIAEEQRRPAKADHQDGASPCRVARARQRHKRQRAALAPIVGPENEHDIFDRDDERQRPHDQRENAKNIRPRCDPAAGRCVQRLAERVDGAGADVAVNDAESAKHENRQLLGVLPRAFGRVQSGLGGGLAVLDNRHQLAPRIIGGVG
jgi:hypothetical protein